MKLTKDDLIRLDVCREGIEDFEETFPSGVDVPEWTLECQLLVLLTPCRKWLGWAWQAGLLPMWSMESIDLIGANLTRAHLHGANLHGANLYRANLYRANLYRADLIGANLVEADLTRANLTEANLHRAMRPENDIPGWWVDDNSRLISK